MGGALVLVATRSNRLFSDRFFHEILIFVFFRVPQHEKLMLLGRCASGHEADSSIDLPWLYATLPSKSKQRDSTLHVQLICCIVHNVPISGKRIVKLLEQRGWAIKSSRGSHVKLVKGSRVTEVPVHGNHDLGIGLIKAIERQTGEKFL